MEDKFYIRTKKIVELINVFEYPEYLLVFWKYEYDEETDKYELFIDIEKTDEEPKTISFRLSYYDIAGLDNCYDHILEEIRKQI